jgi:hypothetical protein
MTNDMVAIKPEPQDLDSGEGGENPFRVKREPVAPSVDSGYDSVELNDVKLEVDALNEIGARAAHFI